MECYLCNSALTEQNKSSEHIIPASLGNNIEREGLLCSTCNNGLASRIDAELIKQFAHLQGLVSKAKPNAKKNDSIVGQFADGTPIRFRGEMEADIEVQIKRKDGTSITFSASSREEAKKKAKQKLIQLKGQNPNLDVEKILSEMKIEYKYDNRLIYFSNDKPLLNIFGNPPFFRGIKKIAINFYLSNGGDIKYVRDVIQQVKKGEPAPKIISRFYYPTIRPVHELGREEVSHIIKLVGNPALRVLYCYVELYNTNHALILLNDEYDGSSIDKQYCYDVLTSKHLDKEISLPFVYRDHVLDTFVIERETAKSGQYFYNRTRKIIEDRMRSKKYIK